jgi:hypothetical protein
LSGFDELHASDDDTRKYNNNRYNNHQLGKGEALLMFEFRV